MSGRVEAAESALTRLLAQKPATGGLPALMHEEPGFIETLRELKDKVFDWIGSLLPTVEPSSGKKLSNDMVIQTLFYGVLTILLALLVWLVVVSVMALSKARRRDAVGFEPPSAKAQMSAHSAYAERIAAHMARGEYAAAMRWRWRLFVQESGLPHDRTPAEHDAARLCVHYPAMYGDAAATEVTFAAFEAALRPPAGAA